MTGGPLHAAGAAGLLAALLLCGHMLGDFVFQTGGLARRKRDKARWVWVHVLVVALTQVAVLLPVMSLLGLVAIAGIAVLHGLTDMLKIALVRRHRRPLTYFALDQGLHLAALALAWWFWRWGTAAALPGSGLWWSLPDALTPLLTTVAVVISAYAFNGTGGASLVGGLLRRYHLGETPGSTGDQAPGSTADDAPGSTGDEPPGEPKGRMIGILERMLILTLVLIGQWGALGLVMAAKSIARFEELKERPFSEYYLIGTLASLLVATVSGLLVKLVL